MRRLAGGVALLAVVLSVLAVPRAPVGAAPSLGAYKGLGTWVDMYNANPWDRPARAVNRMADRGVTTLYLQTANYHKPTSSPVFRPVRTRRFITAAHAHGMAIVSWYLPSFRNLDHDFHRAIKAIKFTTGDGQRFDSFGLDIESSLVSDPEERTRRLMRLSRRIQDRVAADYPLGAIIPSPRGMQLLPDYWPGFPYKRLARIYDVFLPMGYYTYRTDGEAGAYDYTRRCIRLIRLKTDDPSVPIHAIGGLAGDSTRAETRGFVTAAVNKGILGASLYDFPTTSKGDWAELAAAATLP